MTATGTVTNAGGTHHWLANVTVSVRSPSTGAYTSRTVTTAADGSYTVTGQPAAADYVVFFYATGVTGGASDALGYRNQFYKQPADLGLAEPVAVTAGAATTGTNAALAENP